MHHTCDKLQVMPEKNIIIKLLIINIILNISTIFITRKDKNL